MKKTKIIATLGPSSEDPKVIKKLIENGVNAFRLNLSHGNQNYHLNLIKLVRSVDPSIPIIFDLPGPKLRIGKFKEDKVFLKRGSSFIITTKNLIGDKNIVSIAYEDLPKIVNNKDLILLDDGKIKLSVVEKGDDFVKTKVLVGGELSNNKGLNIIGKNINIPSLTENDRSFIELAIDQKIDFIALSFVKDEKDILELKDILNKKNSYIPIISKIEKREAISNLEKIIDVSDGVMVARGDLGVEASLEEVSLLQKKIIRLCLIKRKFSILATQILDSMIERPYPTRAEVSDITNAIFDGVDCLMLSSETAVGKYPDLVIKTMSNICKKVEKEVDYRDLILSLEKRIKKDPILSICYSAVILSLDINAKLIVVTTETGRTAINISRFKPKVPILSLTPNDDVYRRLNLYWGIIPRKVEKFNTHDDIISSIDKEVANSGLLKKGDLYISLSGTIPGVPGGTNIIKVNRF